MSNEISLTKNGRIFPLWVLKNFKKYELPKIIRKEGEDPCNEVIKNELNLYQKFIGQYLNYRSPFRDILVYHGLGSGKTATAINIYNVLYNYTPKWNIIIFIPASLRNDPWMKDLNRWITKKDKDGRMKNIIFVHYDSPFADRDFLDKIKKVDSSNSTMYLFDEAHNFIRNVYNNISSKTGKRAQVIYDYIQQEKIENDKTRIVLLSATPAVNTPYEFALIYNLMRPGTFPKSEAIFNQLYISSTNFASLNENKKNMFQRRIMGLTSYYIGATPDKYASKTVHYKNILMGKYFQEVYDHFEKIEEEKEKIRIRMSRGKVGGDEMSTYATYTRQACNFVFPPISGKINGENRPRPSKFRLKETEALLLDEGKEVQRKNALMLKKETAKQYDKAVKEYINKFIEFLKEIHRKDKKNKHTLQNDVNTFAKKYNYSFTKFNENEKKKSKLFEMLYICSPKMMHIIFNIIKSPGPVLVYSNYVLMEGLQVFKIYLNFFGFTSYDDSKKDKSKDFYRYMEFHGAIDKDTRFKNKNTFNEKDNLKGKIMKIIMISPAGAEGINLSNVRQVHILEPYWNEVRIEQVIGRAIRQCQHKDLPMKDRTVDVFRYKMVRKNGKETSDERMERISRKKNNLLISFIEAIKQAAVDCELFKSHNMMGTKYSCFKFNENSLFEDQIGPAFEFNEEFDEKIDNGSNSLDSKKIKIKVRKINVVELIDENNYSKPFNAWYYDKTGVVYDFELNFPIGKIGKDENNNPKKLDTNTYIMDKLIKIPEFKLFD